MSQKQIFGLGTYHLIVVVVQAIPSIKIKVKLRRFNSDRDEIWKDCSSSKYASDF